MLLCWALRCSCANNADDRRRAGAELNEVELRERTTLKWVVNRMLRLGLETA